MAWIAELEVARAARAGGAQNAADTTVVLIDRVETYYRNETFAAMDHDQPVEDIRARDVSDRDLVPLDIDTVKLYAVVWAKLKSEPQAEFRPYCGAGYHNDGGFFCLGTKFGPGMGEEKKQGYGEKPSAGPGYKFGLMRREHLDPDEFPKLLRWPWQALDFEWQELPYSATSRMISRKVHRTYKYAAARAIDGVTVTDGWTLRLPQNTDARLPAGTRRFRVKIDNLPEGVRLSRKRRNRSLESTGDNRVNRGFALRLCVRMADVPLFSEENDAAGRGPRSTALQESLRWMTAFINTPYENGGFWFGGREKEDDPQDAGYQGHGMDCNGSINVATFLGGVTWPDGHWHHNTFHKGSHARRFPGVQVKPEELRPGDLLDMMPESHVRLVWAVTEAPDGKRWVSWIESAGTPNKVRLVESGQTLSNIAKNFHLINLNDPQPRGKETK
jgi:cell wall-associated NlpC family hydrolase